MYGLADSKLASITVKHPEQTKQRHEEEEVVEEGKRFGIHIYLCS